jgi:hypothetical protein
MIARILEKLLDSYSRESKLSLSKEKSFSFSKSSITKYFQLSSDAKFFKPLSLSLVSTYFQLYFLYITFQKKSFHNGILESVFFHTQTIKDK